MHSPGTSRRKRAVEPLDEVAVPARWLVSLPAPPRQQTIGDAVVSNIAQDGVGLFDARNFVENFQRTVKRR